MHEQPGRSVPLRGTGEGGRAFGAAPLANQRYTVESVSEEGNIRLKGENGCVTINPEKVRAQQHIDYGWAVTGYGAHPALS